MKRTILYFFAFFVFVCLTKAQLPSFRPEVFQLENGLTVILNSHPYSSNVFGLVVVRAGSKNDPTDATGLAHYQEHMLFKGTQELGTIDWEKERIHIQNIFDLYDQLLKETDPKKRQQIQLQINQESLLANQYAIPNELDKLLKSIGSSYINAFTSPDMTAYFNEFPPSEIERWIEIYSHRFINPVFRSFQAELEVVYEEFNMYYDMFFTQILDAFQKNFFRNHPYGQHPVIGKQEHLKNPSLTRMYEFFQTWYVPNNMALILSGNFDASFVKPIIIEKFGQWKPRLLPEIKFPDETPFQGRQLVEVKMSPIPIGILGFRAPSLSHPDYYKLEVLSRLLSNTMQTGVLDKLVLEGKILAAQAIPLPYVDHGALLILFIPKIVGQSLEKAEDLVRSTIREFFTSDNFPPELFEAIKTELYVDYISSFESDQQICLQLAQMFVNGKTIEDIISYPDKLKKLTLDDIKQFGSYILGDNYLAFYSKTGFPKKPKIEKPPFEPLTNHPKNVQSEYFKSVMNMPVNAPAPSLPRYEEQVTTLPVSAHAKLYFTQNPLNEIFTLKIRFYFNKQPSKLLQFSTSLMNMAGTSTETVESIKKKFALLGIKYEFKYADQYVEIELSGLESNITEAMMLIQTILNDPQIDKKHIQTAYQSEKSNRKLELSDADNYASILREYIMYGQNSSYMHRIPLKELNKLNSEIITNDFLKVLNYPMAFFYVGQQQYAEKIAPLLAQIFDRNQPEISALYQKPSQTYSHSQVAFLHKKNSIQSKMFFYTRSGSYEPVQEPVVDMFNMYFGGGFSGLVLREVREFRSMAYAAWANFSYPANPGQPYTFIGFIGTQADKTTEAAEVFMGLMSNMPTDELDIATLSRYLRLSLYNKLPHFREIPETFFIDRLKQWQENPLIYKYDAYQFVSTKDILKFYQEHLQKQPVVIILVADKKRYNPQELAKYGELKKYKLKHIYIK